MHSERQQSVKISFLHGLGLAFQFLTVFPIKKSFEWNKQTARWSIMFYPFVGLVLGVLVSIQASALLGTSAISALVVMLYLFTFSVVMTGGLHLDGWMDCSDAYFSRGDMEKKLEVMKDSRVGAFGVLSVMFLLSWRLVFMYELIKTNSELLWLLFFLIPFLTRTGMVFVLITTPLARKNGMAFAMKEAVTSKMLFGIIGYLIVGLGISFLADLFLLYILLIVIGFIFVWISRRFFIKQFGGITGDMLGACVEGTETWLWFAGWLLLCFVTV